MKASILAAGIGKRISQCTNGKPKCLLEINGETILQHQLNKLVEVGIEEKDIVIVIGYESEQIKKIAGSRIKYIYNEVFDSTNSLYSMWLARKENFNDGMLLFNADVMFHIAILKELLKKNSNAIAVDFNKQLQDGEMNVIVKNGEIVTEISKNIKSTEASGESVQIAKFNSTGIKILFQKSDELIKANIKNTFPAYVFKYIIKETGLFAVDIQNLPWVEIDYPQDLERAKQIKWD